MLPFSGNFWPPLTCWLLHRASAQWPPIGTAVCKLSLACLNVSSCPEIGLKSTPELCCFLFLGCSNSSFSELEKGPAMKCWVQRYQKRKPGGGSGKQNKGFQQFAAQQLLKPHAVSLSWWHFVLLSLSSCFLSPDRHMASWTSCGKQVHS